MTFSDPARREAAGGAAALLEVKAPPPAPQAQRVGLVPPLPEARRALALFCSTEKQRKIEQSTSKSFNIYGKQNNFYT